MTVELAFALASVCGYHEGDGCARCTETLAQCRSRGWSDTEILADIALYLQDFNAWSDKVRAGQHARPASGETT
jgi:hypothetical protein